MGQQVRLFISDYLNGIWKPAENAYWGVSAISGDRANIVLYLGWEDKKIETHSIDYSDPKAYFFDYYYMVSIVGVDRSNHRWVDIQVLPCSEYTGPTHSYIISGRGGAAVMESLESYITSRRGVVIDEVLTEDNGYLLFVKMGVGVSRALLYDLSESYSIIGITPMDEEGSLSNYTLFGGENSVTVVDALKEFITSMGGEVVEDMTGDSDKYVLFIRTTGGLLGGLTTPILSNRFMINLYSNEFHIEPNSPEWDLTSYALRKLRSSSTEIEAGKPTSLLVDIYSPQEGSKRVHFGLVMDGGIPTRKEVLSTYINVDKGYHTREITFTPDTGSLGSHTITAYISENDKTVWSNGISVTVVMPPVPPPLPPKPPKDKSYTNIVAAAGVGLITYYILKRKV